MDRPERSTGSSQEFGTAIGEDLQEKMAKVGEISSTFAAQLEDLLSKPHRHPALHWIAFVLSVVSFVVLVVWGAGSRDAVPPAWVWLDIGLGAFFAGEFLTRSGFRWNPATYAVTHFFDFVAIAPALAFVNHGFVLEGVWVWLILAARAGRTLDRLFGDGFVRRNLLALAEGLEEEITDRVLQRIVARIQEKLDEGHFGQRIAETLVQNKASVLQRIGDAHPRHGFWVGLANIAGLDEALRKAEERTYDAIVGIMNSPEMDRAIRDAVSTTFSGIHGQMGTKTWRQNLGFRSRQTRTKTSCAERS